MTNAKQKTVRIDLDRFKLYLKLTDRCELSLHFNSPSRRFYLSVIALIVTEMKKLGRITSISLDEHWAVLALLNETVGAGAGSSNRENLLPRVYKKWKDALPRLDDAPLFKVLGRKKEYGDGLEKTYLFSDEEKDAWANLFEYKGSDENVRLRFSLDRIGADLEDVVIIYGESTDSTGTSAWNHFVDDLQGLIEDSPGSRKQAGLFNQWARWKFVPMVMAVVVVMAGMLLWNFYLRPDIDPASVEKMAYPLPNKPSIAVLPFENMSGDPGQEYLCDGITEEIITALSKLPKILVIARNSTFSYKGKPVKLREVAEELGVQYVLEGSFRKAGDRVRITAQLVEAMKGTHLWAEKYDRNLRDIFALQDEITLNVLEALQVVLTEGEQARVYGRSTNNLEAYIKLLKGRDRLYRHNENDNHLAMKMFEEAIGLDPNYTTAYEFLAHGHLMDAIFGWGESRDTSFKRAFELTEELHTLDNSSGGAHRILSHYYTLKHQSGKAVEEGKQAVLLDPNDADSYAILGMALGRAANRLEEAITCYKKAIRLNPHPPEWYLTGLGFAYRVVGQYDKAIATYGKVLERDPNHPTALAFCSMALSYTGKHEEAIGLVKKAIDSGPSEYHFTLLAEYYRRLGQYEEAIAECKKLLDSNPIDRYRLRAYVTLTAAYGALRDDEDACSAAAEILRISPNFSLEREKDQAYIWFLQHEEDKKLVDIALNKARVK
jgi:TolB-like protein/Flp pilus assembly protein TadD